MEPFEKVGDEVEMACQLEAQLNEQALLRHRAKLGPQSHPDFDGHHCVECGIDIPLARIAMYRIRCVDCESAIERLNKLRGR